MDTLNQVPRGIDPVHPMPNVTIHESMPEKKNPGLLIVVLIVIAALAFGGYFYKNQNKTKLELKEAAEPGQLVAGFPKKAIIVSDANIMFSKHNVTTRQDDSFDSFTTQFITSASAQSLFDAYSDYLTKNGYEISKKTFLNGQFTVIGSRTIAKEMEILSVSILDRVKGRLVHISLNKDVASTN